MEISGNANSRAENVTRPKPFHDYHCRDKIFASKVAGEWYGPSFQDS